jgi:cyclophilin family peptidyl-prolyl cis-trans isomerase
MKPLILRYKNENWRNMRYLLLLTILTISTTLFAGTKVKIETNHGDIYLELFDKKSPNSVKNFLKYADDGFYTKTNFHRVIKDYIVQGGGYDLEFNKKSTHPQIKNEALNMVKNLKGTIGMARQRPKHSAKSEFYLNLKDNPNLDHSGLGHYGYAVFGKISKGFEVVQKLGAMPSSKKGQHRRFPNEQIRIKSITRQ